MLLKRHGGKRPSTPTTSEPTREMKPPSNCANHLRHTEGEPREPILTLNTMKGKDGVVSGQVFADVHLIGLFPYEKKRS